jgi:hypothetical protein
MDLSFNCHGKTIHVGSSHHHMSTSRQLDNIGPIESVCPHIVDHNNWNGHHGGRRWWGGWWNNPDRFKITGSECM